MQGQLANLIALVAYGNAFLAFGDEEALARANDHFGVTYIYPDFLFERRAGTTDQAGSGVASSPDDWFRWLAASGAARLSYIAFAWNGQKTPGLSESVSVGFSNGVPMAIQAEMGGGTFELWYPSWTVDRSDADMGLVWRVRYHGAPSERDLRVPITPTSVAPRLESALMAAASFAEQNVAGGPWDTIFKKALATLTEPAAPAGGPGAYLPGRGYSEVARRLLASADQAWVFGGMGSWNDLGWSEREIQGDYDTITAALYESVKEACVAAVNSFDASE